MHPGRSYRERIYGSYISSQQSFPPPPDRNGLKARRAYLCQLIRKHFPADPDAPVLDLGCGHGALLHFAKNLGYTNLKGIDTSPEQVAAARLLGIAGVAEGDLLETLHSTPDETYQAVVCFDVIEHFTKQELVELVDEIRRVLRKAGKWIIHCPNAESPFGSRMLFGDFTHEQMFTRASLTQLLLASGFEGVQSFEEAPVPHGPTSLLRTWGWKCIRSLLRLWLAIETGTTGRDAIFTQNFLCIGVKKSEDIKIGQSKVAWKEHCGNGSVQRHGER